ncbi:hypothetical protein [Micromonospora sp. NPDC049891]|uniref:hypothetical protein n=1 Tax=Micromonospora sp. NPDC049891 TaxID=3155655 RepID=UPI003402A87C
MTSESRPWREAGEPEAVIERTGRWWHLVYVRHGLIRWAPSGNGWHVFGAKRANRKARKVLAAYTRLLEKQAFRRVVRAGGETFVERAEQEVWMP